MNDMENDLIVVASVAQLLSAMCDKNNFFQKRNSLP